jgi:hypothetical protein
LEVEEDGIEAAVCNHQRCTIGEQKQLSDESLHVHRNLGAPRRRRWRRRVGEEIGVNENNSIYIDIEIRDNKIFYYFRN